jgi:nucleoside-diphosphate-sugar epimerase
MKLWVTGAASFVGSELLRQCTDRGIDVLGIDAAPSGDHRIARRDICDPDLRQHVPEGIDAVVHLAAVARDTDCRADPVACFSVNVAGTMNVYRAAWIRGARQVIFASSEWVYDRFDPAVPRCEAEPIDPHGLTSEYALSKLTGEAALRQAHLRDGLPVTVLRFGILYGPRPGPGSAVESILGQVAVGDTITVGSRLTARGFVHVGDAARAILAAAGRPGFAIYNVQPARPVTLGEVADRASAILGRSPRVFETAPDRPSVRNVSGALARRELGWQPSISLDDGLRDVARFLGYLPARCALAPRLERSA